MIGTLVGVKYEILSELEPSPLFSSYRAVDRTSGKDVRIRVLEASYSKESKFVEALKDHVDRLRTINHPALERAIDVIDDDDHFVIVSEYVQSNTLDERVKRLASFSVQLAVSTAVTVCEALATVHQSGMVHGDIGGRNVLVTPSGAVKLTMTGYWTTFPASAKAGLAMLRGMAPYLAPEVTSGAMPGPASDIYSIGVLIYQMLSGRCLYLGDSTVAIATKHATAPYPSLRNVNPSVPEALDELIKRCLAKSPEHRYATVSELLSDLRGVQDALRFGRPLTWPIRKDVAEQQPVVPIVETAEPESRKSMRSKERKRPSQDEGDEFPKWLTGLVVLFLAAMFAALGGWVWFNTNQPKLIDLPSLVNKNKVQAAEELRKLHLRMNVEKQQSSDKYPVGVIMSQDPEPGRKKVKENGIVQVVVSAGSRFIEVPDLRGRTEEEAQKLLEALSLELSTSIDRVRDRELDEGLIVSQIPEPRKKIERGSKVRIKISNGNRRVDEEPASNQRYTYKLKVTMPPGAESVLVRIDMTDSQETQTIHEDSHEPSESFTIEHDGYGKEVLFRVFFDNVLIKQVQKTATDADAKNKNEEQ